jgi:Holliday junction resolvase RusA-like endonuclease
MINFEIPGNPIAKGRARAFKRGNYIAHYTPEKTANYENLVKLAAMDSMQGKQLIECPVKLVVKLFFNIPASWSKKKKFCAINGLIRPAVKPDLDNCSKILCDALNGIVWHDDKQVVELIVTKHYSDKPCAQVSIMKISNLP